MIASPQNNMTKTALFTNWTDEQFTGYWDGKGKKFAPGQAVWMPDYLAQHFAKHITNRELVRKDADGNLIYKDGEKFTSPKKPEETPIFMDLFNKAYTPDENEDMGNEADDVDALISTANKNREAGEAETGEGKQNPNEPQVILPPDYDDEETFEGKPEDEEK